MLLIPQSMAYASLAGLPPIHGLYAAMLPPIAAAFFVSSPYLQTGPVAMTAVLALGSLSVLAQPMSADYVGLAALLALVVGVIRVFIGMLRIGFVAYLMSQPVLNGFATGAALLICATQIPTALGVASTQTGIVAPALWALQHPGEWSASAIGLTLVTVLLVAGGKRLHALFPGVLIAVCVGIGYSTLTGYAGQTVGHVAAQMPDWSLGLPWQQLPALLLPGAVIALVGFAEPAAIARTLAAQTRQPWSADREFVSQGIANLAAGVSGGFPVGGSFSRTMLNRAAGGRSRWSGAITGLAVLAFLPIADVLAPLPKAVLAGVVIAAVASLIDLRAMIRIARLSRGQAGVTWLTFATTLLLAPRIDQAVLVGIAASVGVHLWRERRVRINSTYDARTLRIEPVGVLYFGSAPLLDEALIAELAANPDAEKLIIDLQKVGRIDYSGALIIQDIAAHAEGAGLNVQIIPGLPPQGARIVTRVLGEDSPWLAHGGGEE